jgi:hypothetical protein
MHSGFGRPSSVRPALIALVAGTFLSLPALAADDAASPPAAIPAAQSGLPPIDFRLDRDELPTEAVRASLAAFQASQAFALAQADADGLKSGIQMLAIDYDAALGTPKFVRSVAKFLTPPSKALPRDVVYAFADAHANLLGVTGKTLALSPLTRDFGTQDELMHHLTWQQQINGVELFRSELRANISRRGELMNIASTMLTEPQGGWKLPLRKLDQNAAVIAAAANVGIVVTTQLKPTDKKGAQGTIWESTPQFGSQDAIEVRDVFFALSRDEIVPAVWVSIPEKGVGNTYDMVIDAVDGKVLWRHNRLVWDTTQPATYRVYTNDSPSPGSPGRSTPDGFQFPFVARNLVTVNPAEISAFSPNGWIPDGQTATVGNNVDAYLDTANDNTASAADRATGVSRVFDFAANVGLNTGDAPATYRNASITQLFYWSNRYHDRLFSLGFNEASGNFQTTNITGQGTGNDAVKAEAQDGSGTNNANFSTSGTDGTNARCQMYTWTGPNPDRDGSFDADIVFHELTHGLSIRLHRGGLTGTQGGGMGEGWSDFFALCLSAEPADNFDAVYAAGGYVTYQISTGFVNNYYFGIRRYPYSTDMTKNPFTFADVDTAQFGSDGSIPRGVIGWGSAANEVHNVGEIWCSTLLEMRQQLSLSEGFNANTIAMQLAVDGMKLAPSVPDFLDERDAILQADLNRYGGTHSLAIWRAFAKRGMGVNASSPAGGGTSGIVESFDAPIRVDYSYPSGNPVSLSPDVPTTFNAVLSPYNLQITPGTARIWYSIAGAPFVSSPLTLISGNLYSATLPSGPCFADVRYYLTVGTTEGDRSDPATGAAAPYTARVVTSTPVIFADDMEIDRGWVGGQTGDTATSGQWQRGVPQATTAQPGSDHTGGTGVNCWATGLSAGSNAGAFDVDGGFTTLLSPSFDISGHPEAVISYWRWYSNNAGGSPNADTFRVDISTNNGATWTNFETVGPAGAGTGGGWVNFSRRIGDVVTPTSTVRLRFVADDAGAGSLIEAAIDDFRISYDLCVPSVGCVADFNQDGGVDGADVNAFFTAWEAGESSADVNLDGGVDGGDVGDFFAVWENGGC